MKTEPTDRPGRQRTGLFGGTFDPVHAGHLMIAEHIREHARLDTIIFIPAAVPPHKHFDQMFTASERFDMLTAAVASNPHFSVSDIELKRSGPSFTIDTITEIKKTMSADVELFFIVGRDNLYEIEQWKDPRAIVDQCEFLVADRACHPGREIPGWLAGRVTIVDSPLVHISSTEIRMRIVGGKSIRYLVPDAVRDMILAKR